MNHRTITREQVAARYPEPDPHALPFMLPPNRARQVIIEACGKGPQSVAMLAAHMLNAGEHVSSIYATVRVHLPTLIDDRKIEPVLLTDGTTIYRLPAHANFEKDKEEK